MAKKSGLLIKEKNLFVHRGDGELEVSLRISPRKWLLLTLHGTENRKVEAVIKYSENGCPGCGKLQFKRTYKGSL